MKPNYFLQDQADLDDHILRAMIAEEHVPADCLWGGVLVQEAVSMAYDPCSICPHQNRRKCGGRPRNANLVQEISKQAAPQDEVVRVTDDDAGSRRLIRKQHRRQLLRWMDEALQEMSKKRDT